MKVVLLIFRPKLVSPNESENEVQIDHLQANTYHLVKKIVKIGPVDPAIIGLCAICKKITESKTCSPFGKFVSNVWQWCQHKMAAAAGQLLKAAVDMQLSNQLLIFTIIYLISCCYITR